MTPDPVRLPLRVRAAVGATRAVNVASRRLRLGSGTVAGGRAGLVVEPALVARLAVGRTVVLVSGTNGKTTTTRLVAAALEAGGGGTVVTNATGSNMPAGHAAALAAGPGGTPVALEVDEGYVPRLLAEAAPRAVVLLNLSRDQLDRTSEVRMLAGRWRRALEGAVGTTIVANADDPLVAWGAGAAPSVLWAAVGLGWRSDAAGCPACGGRIAFDDAPGRSTAGSLAGPGPGWHCLSCEFARPTPDVWLDLGDGGPWMVRRDGSRLPLELALPGRFNRANAVMAVTAATAVGVPPEAACRAVAAVSEVAGRFATATVDGTRVRLLLAKNPAGWSELLDLLAGGSAPVVVGVNARVADGRDPSWLWDVPFELLAGRPVVATGDRHRDLSVRLRYAEVDHQVAQDPIEAVHLVRGQAEPGESSTSTGDLQSSSTRHRDNELDFIGNYTCFHDMLARVR